MIRQAYTWPLCLALLLGGAGPASAQAADPAARVQALVDDARVAYEEDRHEDAVALLDEAYALYPEPALLINRGRALEAMGRCEEAREGYRRALAQPGDHREAASAALEGAAGCRAPSPVLDPAPVEAAQGADPWPWVLVGTGGALVLVGGAFDLYALGIYEDYQAAGREGSDRAAFDALRGEFVQSAERAGWLYAGGGAVALGGLLWLWLSPAEGPEGSRAGWWLTPGGAGGWARF
jgi:tetratricopeptide (TPR) repeat protein